MSAVSPASAAVPAASTASAAQLNPQLVALVKQLPAAQQAAAMQQLAQMSPAQQQQLLAQVTAQAQQQGAAAGAPTAGADQATLGASATTGATTPSLFKTIAKNALIFGGVGAALGFGASFLPNPLMGITLPAAPILAAIGGGVGAVIGIVKGFLSYKKQVAAAATADMSQNTGTPGAVTPATGEPSAAGSLQPVKTPAGAAAAPSAAPSPKPKTTAASKTASGTYTVKKGDTLGKIAKAHKMTWQELYKLNRKAVGANPNMIYPGLKLVFS